jgi:hypothetical protein
MKDGGAWIRCADVRAAEPQPKLDASEGKSPSPLLHLPRLPLLSSNPTQAVRPKKAVIGL